MIIRNYGVCSRVLLTRLLLTYSPTLLLKNKPVQLACVKHVESVRSEPESNSQL